MQVMTLTDEQKDIMLKAHLSIESIFDLIKDYQQSVETNQIVIKMQEGLMWMSHLVMNGKLKENSSQSDEAKNSIN